MAKLTVYSRPLSYEPQIDYWRTITPYTWCKVKDAENDVEARAVIDSARSRNLEPHDYCVREFDFYNRFCG